MRQFLAILATAMLVQSASAQSLWRNFFTTNRDPIVEVVAGSNATVQATTVGSNLRRFTVNSTATGGTNSLVQTNISYVAVTNAPWQFGDSDLTNWATLNTNVLSTLGQTNISYVAVTNAPWQFGDSDLTNWATLNTNVLSTLGQTNISYTAVTNAPWQYGSANLTNWGQLGTNVLSTLGQTNISYVAVTNAPWQTGSVNLTNWSGISTNLAAFLANNQVFTGSNYFTQPLTLSLATNTPAAGQVLTATSAGSAAWSAPTGGGSAYDPRSVFVGFDDFNWSITATAPNGPLSLTRGNAGGGAVTFSVGYTNAVGIARMASGTAANTDFVTLHSSGFFNNDNNINLTNEVRFNLNNYVPTFADGSAFRFGIASANNWTWIPSGGAYIRYSTNNANFEYITTKSSSTTITDSGVAAQTNTWYSGKIVLLGTGSVVFSITGGAATNVTSNVPTNTSMLHIIQMMKLGGGTSQSVDVDYDYISYGITPSR